MMESLGMRPWEVEVDRPAFLTAGDVLDAMDCWQGEAKARRVNTDRAAQGSSDGPGRRR